VANRLSLENFLHGVDSSFHVEMVDPYIIFKSNPTPAEQPVIHGLWLADDDERKVIFNMLTKCVKAQAVAPTSQTVFQSQQQQQDSKKKQPPQNNDNTPPPPPHSSSQAKAPKQVPQSNNNDIKKKASKAAPTTTKAAVDNSGLLTPAMILGENNVPKLGGGRSKSSALDLETFKASLRELLQDDSFLESLHSKYSSVVASKAK
jgi:outer membrane biosynthesis protein TonB